MHPAAPRWRLIAASAMAAALAAAMAVRRAGGASPQTLPSPLYHDRKLKEAADVMDNALAIRSRTHTCSITPGCLLAGR
jgi:hypothetical protein